MFENHFPFIAFHMKKLIKSFFIKASNKLKTLQKINGHCQFILRERVKIKNRYRQLNEGKQASKKQTTQSSPSGLEGWCQGEISARDCDVDWSLGLHSCSGALDSMLGLGLLLSGFISDTSQHI